MDNQNKCNTLTEPGYDTSCTISEQRSLSSFDRDKIRQINIEQLDYGYIVRVGCQTLAISDKSKLIASLIEYINEPGKTEDKYYERKLSL